MTSNPNVSNLVQSSSTPFTTNTTVNPSATSAPGSTGAPTNTTFTNPALRALMMTFNANPTTAAYAALNGYFTALAAIGRNPVSVNTTQPQTPFYGYPQTEQPTTVIKDDKPKTPSHFNKNVMNPGPDGKKGVALTNGMLMRRLEKLGNPTKNFGEGGEQWVSCKNGAERWIKTDEKWRMAEAVYDDGKKISNDQMLKYMDGPVDGMKFHQGDVNKDRFVYTLDKNGSEVEWERTDKGWQKVGLVTSYSDEYGSKPDDTAIPQVGANQDADTAPGISNEDLAKDLDLIDEAFSKFEATEEWADYLN